jgi:hypothetical protein
MCVQNVNGVGQEPSEVEAGAVDLARVELDQSGFGYPGAGWREECDLVAQLCQASRQPHDDPLGSAVPSGGKTTMGVECDVHAGAMYDSLFPDAKGRGA